MLGNFKVKRSFFLYLFFIVLIVFFLILSIVVLNTELITTSSINNQNENQESNEPVISSSSGGMPIVNNTSMVDFSSTYLEVNDIELPIGTDILLNPILKDWTVRVIGVVVEKNNDSFVLENKVKGGENTKIEIKKCQDGQDIVFKIYEETTRQSRNVMFEQINVGTTMNGIGEIVQLPNGDWSVCGTHFIISKI